MYHQLAGWDTIMPESMATYTRGKQTYRRAAVPALETRLWMYAGIAGGITPWWHIVGGNQEDRRIYEVPVPVLEWYRKNEAYLYRRRPVANVAILWNQRNADYYGGSRVSERVDSALRGTVMALTRAGIPCLPIFTADMAEQLNGAGAGIDLVILPELALITDDEVKELEKFAARGGGIFALGAAGILDKDGGIREKSVLENILGIDYSTLQSDGKAGEANWENPVLHNYLRIEEPAHPVFAGFEETATLPMGGTRQEVFARAGVKVLATYIPPYPIYPPEFAWTDLKRTGEAVITEYVNPAGGRALYAAWDLDSGYGRAAHPDHGDLIGNIVSYLLDGRPAAQVSCEAYIDFKFYWQEIDGRDAGAGGGAAAAPRQGDAGVNGGPAGDLRRRLIIHLINGNHTGFEAGYAEKNIGVGPLTITVDPGRIPALGGFRPRRAFATVDGAAVVLAAGENGRFTVTVEKLGIHQLIIVE
jgi:hypothetical protein